MHVWLAWTTHPCILNAHLYCSNGTSGAETSQPKSPTAHFPGYNGASATLTHHRNERLLLPEQGKLPVLVYIVIMQMWSPYIIMLRLPVSRIMYHYTHTVTTATISSIPSLSQSDSDSGSDSEEIKQARDRIRYVKEKIEREEFLQVGSINLVNHKCWLIIVCIGHQNEGTRWYCCRGKATAHVIIEGTSRDQVMPASIAGMS